MSESACSFLICTNLHELDAESIERNMLPVEATGSFDDTSHEFFAVSCGDIRLRQMCEQNAEFAPLLAAPSVMTMIEIGSCVESGCSMSGKYISMI